MKEKTAMSVLPLKVLLLMDLMREKIPEGPAGLLQGHSVTRKYPALMLKKLNPVGIAISTKK